MKSASKKGPGKGSASKGVTPAQVKAIRARNVAGDSTAKSLGVTKMADGSYGRPRKPGDFRGPGLERDKAASDSVSAVRKRTYDSSIAKSAPKKPSSSMASSKGKK